MPSSHQSNPRCIGFILLTLGVTSILWIAILQLKDLDFHSCSNETDNKNNTLTFHINGSETTRINYIINSTNSIHFQNNSLNNVQHKYFTKCNSHKLKVLFICLGLVFLGTLWLTVSCFIVCGCKNETNIEFTLRSGAGKTPERSRIRFINLRRQYDRFQSWRCTRLFAKHSMLTKLRQSDPVDQQILSNLDRYLKKAWHSRPTDYTEYKTHQQEYGINIRAVYRINNRKLWDSFEGDKSSLEKIVHNLMASRRVYNDSIHSHPGSSKAAKNKDMPKNIEHVTSFVEKAPTAQEEDTASVSGTDHITEESDEDTAIPSTPLLHDVEPVRSNGPCSNHIPHNSDQITAAASQLQQPSTSAHTADLDEGDGESLASDSSHESLPLLARSWRVSKSSLGPPVSSPRALIETCMFLLHGTPIQNVLSIIERGIDMSRSNDTKPYGPVLSVSESSWVADKYTTSRITPRNNHLTILVLRTSLKHAYWRLHGEHVPPSIARNYDGLVSGNKRGYRQFRLFKAKCCYPEFLVIYDRVLQHRFPWVESWI